MTRKKTVKRKRSGGRKRPSKIDKLPISPQKQRQIILREHLLKLADEDASVRGGWLAQSNMYHRGKQYLGSKIGFIEVHAEDRAWGVEAILARLWGNVRVDSILVSDNVAMFRTTYGGIPDTISQEQMDKLRYECEHAFQRMYGDVEMIDIWLNDNELELTAVLYNSWIAPVYASTNGHDAWRLEIIKSYIEAGGVRSGKYATQDLDRALSALQSRHFKRMTR